MGYKKKKKVWSGFDASLYRLNYKKSRCSTNCLEFISDINHSPDLKYPPCFYHYKNSADM